MGAALRKLEASLAPLLPCATKPEARDRNHSVPPPPLRALAAAAAARLLQLQLALHATHTAITAAGEAAAGEAAAGGAARSSPVLRYRVQRKRLWRVAEEVLRAHLAEQS